MTEPSKTISLTIWDNEYEVKFPNNGQLIDIETFKIALGKGTKDNLLLNPTQNSILAYTTLEMVATFTYVIPELIEDLLGKKKSLLELSPIESKQLVDVYMKVYTPWHNDWMKVINADLQKVDEEEIVEDEDVVELK